MKGCVIHKDLWRTHIIPMVLGSARYCVRRRGRLALVCRFFASVVRKTWFGPLRTFQWNPQLWILEYKLPGNSEEVENRMLWFQKNRLQDVGDCNTFWGFSDVIRHHGYQDLSLYHKIPMNKIDFSRIKGLLALGEHCIVIVCQKDKRPHIEWIRNHATKRELY